MQPKASKSAEPNNESAEVHADVSKSSDEIKIPSGKSMKNYTILRGSFAGGWQSNVDLPDRRRIIIGIAKLIDRMQPSGKDHQK